MYNNKLKAIVLPVVIALAIVLGMGINSLLDRKEVPVNMSQRMIGSKLDYILNMINYSYVDSVDIHKIEEDAIPQILNDLDPHTVYIPAPVASDPVSGIFVQGHIDLFIVGKLLFCFPGQALDIHLLQLPATGIDLRVVTTREGGRRCTATC